MYALADCNNFFVSCERVFRPELNGKPVIVLSNNDGCAIARSNEAKVLGIRMGEPFFRIREMVEKNGVAVFSSNYSLYGDMSRRVQEVLRHYAPSVEVYSIDECFLDLTGMDLDLDAYAREISLACRKLTGIPVSVGIAPSKTLAKIASKLCKKYPKLNGGCFMHRPQDIEKVLRELPAKDVWGIGKRSRPKLEEMGVQSAWDYARLPEAVVLARFRMPGLRTWKELNGIPAIAFEDMIPPKKSICVSHNFVRDVYDSCEFCEQITAYAGNALSKLRDQQSQVREMVVFAMAGKSCFKARVQQSYTSALYVFPEATDDYRTVIAAASETARGLFRPGLGYKHAGVAFTDIVWPESRTLPLFADEAACQKNARLSEAVDAINQNFGKGTVFFGVQGDGLIHMTQSHLSPRYTTCWEEIPSVSVR